MPSANFKVKILFQVIALSAIIWRVSSPEAQAYTCYVTQSSGSSGTTPSEPNQTVSKKLETESPIERLLSGGEVHTYELAVAADQYLHIIVFQRGIDVVVTVIDPDDKQIIEVDNPNGVQGPEPVILLSKSSGIFKVNVRSLENAAPQGKYEIRIVELRTATEDDRALQEARNLYDQSVKLQEEGRYDKALAPAEQALIIRKKVLGSEDYSLAELLSNLGGLYHAKGEYRKAAEQYQQALAIQEKARGVESDEIAITLNNAGEAYRAQGDYAKAEQMYLHSLMLREKLIGREHPDVAIVLNNLALSYRAKGDYPKAEPLFERAQKIFEQAFGPDHANVGAVLNNLAGLYEAKGDYIKAEPMYQRALNIAEKALGPEHQSVALSLNNLALLYNQKGDYIKAEPLFRRALAIFEKRLGEGHPYVAKSLNNLALVYRAKGADAEAAPLFRRALEIWESRLGPEHPEVASVLNNLAALTYALGDRYTAEGLFQRSLRLREKVFGAEHPDVAISLNNLAALYYSQEKYSSAEPLFQRALMIREKILGREHPEVAASISDLALLYEATGNIPLAIDYAIRGSEISERNISLNLATGAQRQKLLYLATLSEETNRILSLHIMSAPSDGVMCRLALTSVLRRKGRVLDAMTEGLAIFRRRLDPQAQALLDQLITLRSQLASLVLNGPGSLSVKEHEAEIKSLKERAERLDGEISLQSAEFRAQSRPVTIESVQAKIPAHTTLVEFVLYQPLNLKFAKYAERYAEPRYVAYILSHDGDPRWVDLGDARPIHASVNAFLEALQDPRRRDVNQLGRALDVQVMSPVRKLLGQARTVLLSTDALLNLIPFGALVDEDNKPLIETYSFTYLTSGRDLLRNQVELPITQRAMVVADPDFGRQISSAGGSSIRQSGSAPLSNVHFKRLPGTAGQSRALRKLLPGATILTGTQATEAAIKKVQRPTLLHVATHGFFLSRLDDTVQMARGFSDVMGVSVYRREGRLPTPNRLNAEIENALLRSGLVFAGANSHGGKDNDGILTALEAMNLNLWGTKLVVLSACETGVGEVNTGDGVYGFRRALVLAGSESQVMSLWQVSDAATRDLMLAYYASLLAGKERGEALRKVQLQMLKSVNRWHPYYWAGFIQSGDWTSFRIK